ncbi:hypothetical protein ACVJBD_007016 [Rhizobium mongolense]
MLKSQSTSRPVSSDAFLRAFKDDADRKRGLVRRAEAAKARLAFVTEAMRRLLQNDDVRSLLAEEGLLNLPAAFAERIGKREGE